MVVLLKEKALEHLAKKSPPKQDSVVQAQPGPDKDGKKKKRQGKCCEEQHGKIGEARILSQWKKVRRSHLRAATSIPSQ